MARELLIISLGLLPKTSLSIYQTFSGHAKDKVKGIQPNGKEVPLAVYCWTPIEKRRRMRGAQGHLSLPPSIKLFGCPDTVFGVDWPPTPF